MFIFLCILGSSESKWIIELNYVINQEMIFIGLLKILQGSDSL